MKKQLIILLSMVFVLVFFGGYPFFNFKFKNSQIVQSHENISNIQQKQIDNLQKELNILKQKEPNSVKIVQPLESVEKFNPDIPSIVSEWRNRTAFLVCGGIDIYGQPYTQTATAYIHRFSGDIKVRAVTNRHAVTDDYGNLVSNCEIKIPTDQNPIFISSHDLTFHSDSSIDVSQISLDNNDPFISSLDKKKVCSAEGIKINTGDQIVILGYPLIGSTADVTATEGIISGYTYPYYITSAKIDHGNSGGLAILVKEDCFLGLPTGSSIGSIESLGRILDAGVIAK